jgi:NADH-quinone oxidoreductase subunit N
MNLNEYLLLKPELSLCGLFLALIIYDLCSAEKGKKYFFPVACSLLLLHSTLCALMLFFQPQEQITAFGGMYLSSTAQLAIKNILNAGLLLIFLQCGGWLRSPDTHHKQGEFYMLATLTLLGMYLMVSAGNFLLFYIGLETASLPVAALVALDKYRRHAAEAGAKYIFNAIFSSAVMIFGLSFIYGSCQSLYFGAMHITAQEPMLLMGLIFFMSGLFFKISLVPFHFWAADVYQGAPTNVTLYLSTVSKGAAIFALMFILYRVFGAMAQQWQAVLSIVIMLTILVGNLFALRQKNMKRFLAFSSISQAGYIILSVINGSPMGMSATLFYILVYVFSNAAAFGVITAIENKTGKVNMDDYNGLYKTNPKLTWVMTMAMFSLGGIPPTAGFFSKYFVFLAAMEQGYVFLVFFALLNTIIALYYYLLVVKAMFINASEHPVEKFNSDTPLRISLVAAVAGIALLGLISVIYESLVPISFGI